MSMKRILICSILCLGMLSLGSLATAGVTSGSFSESTWSMGATWGWNPEDLSPLTGMRFRAKLPL